MENRQNDLSNVIANDLCIGCGACVQATPGLRLKLNQEKLFYEPDGMGDSLASSVCPAVQVDFAGLQQYLFPGQEAGPFGVVAKVYLSQSTNRDRNLKASSGGLIKELLRAYLDQPDVDGAIVLDHVEGLLFKPKLITKVEDVDLLPGSIYHSNPFDDALKILRENTGRFILVAIPCQLEGIYSYIRQVEPALRERIHTTIGLICGWTYTHHSIRAICEFRKVDPKQIVDISYRGGGPVGRLRLALQDGRVVAVHRRVHFAYQVAFDRSFNIPRCHLCINHSNFLADIVVGDAWLPSTVGTRTGISLVICRKRATVSQMDHLKVTGRVRSTEVSVDEIEESQTHRVVFGDFSYAYSDYLKSRQRFCPEMVGPNIAECHPWTERAVSAFDRENTEKIKLHRAGQYRRLYVRKMTFELNKLAYRYIRWFFIRVLKVKSLTGKRKEIASEQLRDFE